MFAYGRPRARRAADEARAVLVALSTCGLLFFSACQGNGPTDPGASDQNPDPSGGGPNPQAALECERDGYPCSLADVPLEILARSDALSDSVARMLEDGAPPSQTVAWLENQVDMAEVESDDDAIRFRLNGGRGTWILLEGAFTRIPLDPPAPSSGATAPVGSSTPDRVVVREESEQKRALALSPVLYDFTPFDEGETVAGILDGTRGYEGGVVYLHNDAPAATQVGVESFLGWQTYQVVNVATHGARVCHPTGCRAVLAATNLLALVTSDQSVEDAIHLLKQVGLEVGRAEAESRGLDLETGVNYILITADFLRNAYPSGLDDTVVFLNACSSFASQGTDIVEALQGTTSVVLGWDESVFEDDPLNAAVALYTDLSEGGYPAELAYERLGDLRFGSAPEGVVPPTLIFGNRPAGGDLRIRDVVTLLDPASGQPLTASSVVGINGVAKDGEEDEATYTVRVDGMTPELAAQAVLHVSVGEASADPVNVSEGVSDDHDRWTLSGTVPLGFDLQEDTQVTYRTWVDLPDEGKSEQQTSVTLTGTEQIMGRTWDFTAVDSAYWIGLVNTPQVSTAHLTLSFAPGQDPNEPNPDYIITGGTVTFDWNFTIEECSYSGGITFDVTDEIANQSRLSFITSEQPVGYWGFVSTVGPEFTAIEKCGIDGQENTRSQGATDTWMYLPQISDAEAVSSDNRTIVGEYRNQVDFTNQSYVRVSHYVITRVE